MKQQQVSSRGMLVMMGQNDTYVGLTGDLLYVAFSCTLLLSCLFHLLCCVVLLCFAGGIPYSSITMLFDRRVLVLVVLVLLALTCVDAASKKKITKPVQSKWVRLVMDIGTDHIRTMVYNPDADQEFVQVKTDIEESAYVCHETVHQ
jgi:hypothetical protein